MTDTQNEVFKSPVNKIRLFEHGAPGSQNLKLTRKYYTEDMPDGRVKHIVQNITDPDIVPYIPDGIGNSTDRQRIPAVLIIPGGAFRRLVYNFEGEDVAKWLNSMGIAAFVLECRLPSDEHDNAEDVPLIDAMRALKLIRQINKLNNRYSKEYEGAIKQVTAELEKENICLVNHVQLDEEQQLFVDSFYQQRLNGFISPVWLKSVKQLGNEADENIFLAVKMRKEGHKVGEYAIIELPVAQAGRFIRLPDKDGKNYLMYLDDVVRYCLPLIFHGMNYKHFEAYAFKFTKDAEMEIDNDLRNGMMQKISKGVKSRKRGEPLRVIYDASMPKDLLKRVMNKLNLDKLDTVLGGGKYHNHKDLMRFPDCGRKDLKYPEWTPVLKNELSGNVGMLELIRRKDRFIHVPYHSFDSYIRILQEAAINKEVKSIKTTLYRLAKDSKVVKALINAARNGKKVTVVIELLARFDEASNIDWSKKMQDAGIRVIFGVEGLKVHSKITYISMKTGADIACISTGNFHEGNARMYTDYMLMTAAKNVTRDVSLVFDFIERPYSPVRFKELLVSPNVTKKDLSRIGNLCIMGVIGIIIASLVNMFLHNSMMDLIISCVGVLLFVGLTAYDSQKIKQLLTADDIEVNESTQKIALMGAMTLYLDFINLFLYLLRLLGDRK